MTTESAKVAVITGANAGLGFQISISLARMGMRVVMACRNMEKAERARDELLAEVPGADASILQLDVSEPESIQAFGRQFSGEVGRLDLLVNNAGIVAIPLARNSQGYELQFATNYLGVFALTGTLLPFFRNVTGNRIVNVGSLAHRFGKLTLDDLNWEKGEYREMAAYARSKVAMLSFTMELDRRLRQSGSHIIALGAHPGFAATNITAGNTALTPKGALGKWFNEKMSLLVPAAAQAARPIVHAATADGVSGGDYYGPRGLFEIAGKPGRARVNPVARDVEVGRQLWALTEEMTGIRYLSGL